MHQPHQKKAKNVFSSQIKANQQLQINYIPKKHRNAKYIQNSLEKGRPKVFDLIQQLSSFYKRETIKALTYYDRKVNILNNISSHQSPKSLFPQDQWYSNHQHYLQEFNLLKKIQQTTQFQLTDQCISRFVQNTPIGNRGILILSSSSFQLLPQKLIFMTQPHNFQFFQPAQNFNNHLLINSQRQQNLSLFQKFQTLIYPRLLYLRNQNQKIQPTIGSGFQNQFNMRQILQDNFRSKHYEGSQPDQQRAQGYFTINYIQIETQPFEILRKVNRQLRKSNLFVLKLYWNEQFVALLKLILHNNEVYEYEYCQTLYTFLRLNQYKMLNLSCEFSVKSYSLLYNLYEKIYPGITSLLNTLLQKLQVQLLATQSVLFNEEIQSNVGLIKLKQLSRDEQDNFFLEELRKTYKIDKQTALQQVFFKQYKAVLYILKNNIQKIDNNFHWPFENQLKIYLQQTQKVFHKQINIAQLSATIRTYLDEQLMASKLKLKKKKPQFDHYFNQIQLQIVIQPKCLGCSRVFLMDKCIYDDTVSDIPLKTFPTIHKLKDYEVEFKDTICAMLNNGGGIIIFGCELIKHRLYARGQYLTEKDKEQKEQSITSYFRWFYPRPEINRNIKITFVPIISVDNSIKEEESGQHIKFNFVNKKQSNFLEGIFITRLRIAPSQGSYVHFWFHSKKQPRKENKEDIAAKYCNVLDQHNTPKLINFREMRKFIKRKFKQWYIPFQKNPINQLLLQKSVNIFGHQCFEPQKGQQITKKQVMLDLKVAPQQQGRQKIKIQGYTSFEKLFSHMTLLIAKKNDLQRVKAKLLEGGVQCQLQIRFAQHNFKPASNAAIIYHEKTFEAVHNLIVNDPRFRFSTGKPFMTVNVTKYLLFQFRNQRSKLDSNTILKYSEWLNQQFSNQSIDFYEYQVDLKRREYYLYTSSKLSLLFMYFKINHNGDKVSLKNPFNLQKYSPEQKANQFKRLKVNQQGQVFICSGSNNNHKQRQQSRILKLFKNQFIAYDQNLSNYVQQSYSTGQEWQIRQLNSQSVYKRESYE